MIKLTFELAKKEIEEIKASSNDYERAHILEDSLYLWFIRCCAKGMYQDATEVYYIAELLQKTQEIKFERHCA